MNMSTLFNLFKGFSANVYLSLFWGYLILHLLLKYKILFIDNSLDTNYYLYSKVRQRYYIGILIFIIPAAITLIVNLNASEKYSLNSVSMKYYKDGFTIVNEK